MGACQFSWQWVIDTGCTRLGGLALMLLIKPPGHVRAGSEGMSMKHFELSMCTVPLQTISSQILLLLLGNGRETRMPGPPLSLLSIHKEMGSNRSGLSSELLSRRACCVQMPSMIGSTPMGMAAFTSAKRHERKWTKCRSRQSAKALAESQAAQDKFKVWLLGRGVSQQRSNSKRLAEGKQPPCSPSQLGPDLSHWHQVQSAGANGAHSRRSPQGASGAFWEGSLVLVQDGTPVP